MPFITNVSPLLPGWKIAALATGEAPGEGLDEPPGAALGEAPGEGLDEPPGAALDEAPGEGLDEPPGAALDEAPGEGLDEPPVAGDEAIGFGEVPTEAPLPPQPAMTVTAASRPKTA